MAGSPSSSSSPSPWASAGGSASSVAPRPDDASAEDLSHAAFFEAINRSAAASSANRLHGAASGVGASSSLPMPEEEEDPDATIRQFDLLARICRA